MWGCVTAQTTALKPALPALVETRLPLTLRSENGVPAPAWAATPSLSNVIDSLLFSEPQFPHPSSENINLSFVRLILGPNEITNGHNLDVTAIRTFVLNSFCIFFHNLKTNQRKRPKDKELRSRSPFHPPDGLQEACQNVCSFSRDSWNLFGISIFIK